MGFTSQVSISKACSNGSGSGGKGAPGQIAWECGDGLCRRISQTATWRGSRISKKGQRGCVPTPMSPTFPEVPLGMSAVKNVGWGSLPAVGNDSRLLSAEAAWTKEHARENCFRGGVSRGFQWEGPEAGDRGALQSLRLVVTGRQACAGHSAEEGRGGVTAQEGYRAACSPALHPEARGLGPGPPSRPAALLS